MPEQSHPPYESGALVIPRQLQRWLDVNPQNGPLRRTEKYISIPSFNIVHAWNGYSEIVGEYHFEAPNNFSLKIPHDGDVISLGTNYTLCVSYVNSDNSVVRYSLIRGAGDIFYFDLPVYNGQLIKKNFRIEIWNTSQVTCSDTSTTNIYTSVLGSQDYRYGVDSVLKQANPLCQGQQSVGTVALSPDNIGDGIPFSFWLDGGSGIVGTNWTDRTTGIIFSKTSGAGQIVVVPPNYAQFTGQIYTGIVGVPVVDVFMNYVFHSQILGNIITMTVGGNSIRLRQIAGGFLELDINGVPVITSTYSDSSDDDVIIRFTSTLADGSSIKLYNKAGILLFEGVSVTGIDITNPVIALGAVIFDTRGLVAYQSPVFGDSLNVSLSYMQSLYSGGSAMTLPLTWGLCAQPTLNN